MKDKRSILMVAAVTCTLAYFCSTMAKADLTFNSFENTWWVIQKSMDKGYEFPPQSEGMSKAQKQTSRAPKGYFYIPDPSLNATAFENVVAVFIDEGSWVANPPFRLTISAGTPTDFALLSRDEGATYRDMVVLRVKATEDKKAEGMIKSGKMSILGSAFTRTRSGSGDTFVGTVQFKAKWMPEDKVPDEVKNALP